MTLVDRAARFAVAAHGAQQRKYTGEPYTAHLAAVAAKVRLAGGDDVMVAAAWLHDTLEDTATTVDQLEAEFGPEVTGLVVELTDVFTKERFPHMNRRERKIRETIRLGAVSKRAKLIKLMDLADNTESITTHDPKFARVYLEEKAQLLAAIS